MKADFNFSIISSIFYFPENKAGKKGNKKLSQYNFYFDIVYFPFWLKPLLFRHQYIPRS